MKYKVIKPLKARGKFRRADFKEISSERLPSGLTVKRIEATNGHVNPAYRSGLWIEDQQGRVRVVYGPANELQGLKHDIEKRPSNVVFKAAQAGEHVFTSRDDLPRYLGKHERSLGDKLYSHKTSQPRRPLTKREEIEEATNDE
jgi:hypothetical protein